MTIKHISELQINSTYNVDDIKDAVLFEIDKNDSQGLVFSFIRATTHSNLYFMCTETHINQLIKGGKIKLK